ncbi:hypothetical protein RKD37_004787 [Streptomyces ambofaciens]
MRWTVASSTPKCTKSARPSPSSSTTPMAAYRAWARSAAVSQIRFSVACSPSPLPTERIASSSFGTRASNSAGVPSRGGGEPGGGAGDMTRA